MSEIEERLAELERLGLHRRLRMVSGPQGPRVLLDGNPVLLLCSNHHHRAFEQRRGKRRRMTPRALAEAPNR